MNKQLEAYLYQNIPITKALGIQVEDASLDKVVLFAPFANNINHKKTVFGGSLHAVATMACWTLLYVNLKKLRDLHVEIVITESDVRYLAPIDDDFKAVSVLPEEAEMARFIQMLRLKGKARIRLSAKMYHKEKLAVDYHAV